MTRAALIRSLLLLALLVGGQWLSVVHAQSHDAKLPSADTCELCLLASAHGAGATATTPSWLPPATAPAARTASPARVVSAPSTHTLIRGPPALNTH